MAEIFENVSFDPRLATGRPPGERSKPCLAAERRTARDEVARGRLVLLKVARLDFFRGIPPKFEH